MVGLVRRITSSVVFRIAVSVLGSPARRLTAMGEKSCENCLFWHGDELRPRKACTAHEGFCATIELEHWQLLTMQLLKPRPEVEKP
jgi:hypothetical protein